MYEDYALNEFLFRKNILLFVREQKEDEYRLAMSYVFLGEASFVKSYGASFRQIMNSHIIKYFIIDSGWLKAFGFE